MKLAAYLVDGYVDARLAPLEPDCMDKSDQCFAYRCLRLNIANAHGWEVLRPTAFTALRTGYPGLAKSTFKVLAMPSRRLSAISASAC